MQKILAIVGRPNVGKSTLFNRLVGRRQALVDDTPGVTRDRLYGTCDWVGHEWIVVDTGGMMPPNEGILADLITAQSQAAIDEADGVICVFDARAGLTMLDRAMVDVVRKATVPVFYAVNKCDDDEIIDDFFALGVTPLFPISAEHGRHVDALLDAVVAQVPSQIPKSDVEDDEDLAEMEAVEIDDGETDRALVERKPDIDRPFRVAIFGRPNVGKSTLVNTLLGETRVVAHDMPGTTRDVIDVEVTRGEQTLVLLDTAGIRRKARTSEALEKFAIIKSLRSVERADVVVCVLDAAEGATHQDRSLVAEAVARGRPTIILMNKWDLIRDKFDERIAGTRVVLGEAGHLPILCGSAQHGQGMDQLWRTIFDYARGSSRRLSTSALNTVLEHAQKNHHLPSFRGHFVKIYYATQIATKPPRIAMFTNFPQAIPGSYNRYLLHAFEEAFGLPGLPIKLQFRRK